MENTGRFIASTLIMFVFWLAYTSSLAAAEVITGLVVSAVISFFTYKSFIKSGIPADIIKRFFYFLLYLPRFIFEMVKANIDVARRVINPSLPIEPGIVAIETDLNTDVGRMFLANSITLTPGTLTIDIEDNTLFIHWIDVITKNPDEQKGFIAASFENLLKEVF